MSANFPPVSDPAGARVVLRVDGNPRIGLGHRTRCQVLAGLLAEASFSCVWATRDPQPAPSTSEDNAHYWLIPANLPLLAEPEWLAGRLRPSDILVLDGYDFDAAYQQHCKRQARALVCFDDFATDRAAGYADVVLNAAGGVDAARYAYRAPGTQLCLGPGFALLRPEFWRARQRLGAAPNTNRIFLNMGGADPDNHTLRLLPALQTRFPGRDISVVTGAAYPHQAVLAAAASGQPGVRLHHNLPADAMAELLGSCGIFVCPPSGMAYECCALGGLLLLYPTADNQQLLFDYLTRAGLARPYAELNTLPDEQLPALAAAMQTAQHKTFNPEGSAQRFGQVFRELANTYALQVRRAAPADAGLYFDWANDPAVRANAIDPAPIQWPGHQVWFERRLADSDAYLYLFAEAGQYVGQVRIEFTGDKGLIDYSVAAERRGQGLGRALLRRALTELRRERPGAWRLRAEVKTTNPASARVFERLDFTPLAPVQRAEHWFAQFELQVPALPTFAA